VLCSGVCRKVSAPVLPEEAWASGAATVSYEQLLESTPFSVLWRDVLPVLCVAFTAVLGVYAPAMRAQVRQWHA
jgi:hypothetical protein